MARNHALTPWGKCVKMRLLELDIPAAKLPELLREKGIITSRATISGMMHGYRGSRSEQIVDAINKILGIETEIAGRPA